jgi:transcriptional regulator with XRE-family HTH domain
MDEATIVAAFAGKLKSLRLLNGLTLEELARLSGVSISTISKIENNQQRPSFETVLRIARALKINFVQLLEPTLPAEIPAQSNLARRIVTRAPDTTVYSSQWYTYHAHSAELTRKAMIPFLMRIKTRELPPLDEWSIHEGEEFIYVLEGILEFHTEHYAPALLNPGDSCYLDSTMRHAFVTKSEADAVLLSVCRSIIPFADIGANPIEPSTSNAS